MKLVIFDCDGTLVDSQYKIAAAMKRAFEAAGQVWPGHEATLSIVGLSLGEAMQKLAPEAGPEEHHALVEAYRATFFTMSRQEMDNEPFYDGAREALERLSARDDILLAIATGKSQRGLRRMIEREGLEDMFVTLQTSDDAPSKPHPAMVIQAMDVAGVTSRDKAVVVGDTSYDIEMARAAGVHALGVSWGYQDPAVLRAAGAHAVIDHFSQLDDFLASIWG